MRLRLQVWLPVAFLVLFFCSSVCAVSQDQQANATNATASKAAEAPPHPETEHRPDKAEPYRIGVGDVLHITVWEEPQFTEVAIVRPDGMVSIPLIAEVPVAGRTPEGAEAILTERLLKFVHKPRVTVTVQEIRSRMVYITGEVQRPGAYPLLDTMNVVQLVARSGGLTDFAKTKQVYVLRAGSGARIDIDYRKVLQGHAPEQNLSLAPGDTVVVP
jgi:polysaccharide biosynthesis/export protein